MKLDRIALWAAVYLLVALAPSMGQETKSSSGTDDPLPSWNEGAAKKAILDFVAKVTKEGSPGFVPVAERIAVFDNDGTLWPENPVPFQAAYVLDELKRRAPKEPKLAEDPMVKAALTGDVAKLLEGEHHDGLMRIAALTHAGMTTEEFKTSVETWLATAKHPKFDKPYDQLTYQPMQEVLRYLRANGFKTFIVSGGGADFMRVWAERVYGIPPEQVVGSTARTKFELRESGPTLVKTLEHLFVDDKALLKTVKSIVTDSKGLDEPKDPATDTVFRLFELVATPDDTATLRRKYEAGGFGYGHAKQALYDVLVTRFREERHLFNELITDLPELDRRLAIGAERAQAYGTDVLNRVRERMGLRKRD